MRRCVASALALAWLIGAAACGRADPPLPTTCTQGRAEIAAALRRAPAPVALDDGTTLSTCIERARRDADVQTVGGLFTQVGDELGSRADHSRLAAVQLGYLIGATRRGSRRTTGIHLELQRRLEQTVVLSHLPADSRAAFQRGLAAGEASG